MKMIDYLNSTKLTKISFTFEDNWTFILGKDIEDDEDE